MSSGLFLADFLKFMNKKFYFLPVVKYFLGPLIYRGPAQISHYEHMILLFTSYE